MDFENVPPPIADEPIYGSNHKGHENLVEEYRTEKKAYCHSPFSFTYKTGREHIRGTWFEIS